MQREAIEDFQLDQHNLIIVPTLGKGLKEARDREVTFLKRLF